MLLSVLADKVDVIVTGFIGGYANYTILKEGQEKNNYRVTIYNWPPDYMGGVFSNFHHEDPARATLYQGKRFHRALSVAINRGEVNSMGISFLEYTKSFTKR